MHIAEEDAPPEVYPTHFIPDGDDPVEAMLHMRVLWLRMWL
jgi:hypothetical protein